MNLGSVPATSVEVFLEALFPRAAEGLLELRALPSRVQIFVAPRDVRRVHRFAERHRSENVFFGVATRRTRGDGSLANCVDIWSLWVDIDFKTVAEAEARQLLEALHLPPSIIVRSGHGLHLYWLLRTCLDAQQDETRLRAVSRRLAHALRADLSAAEPARLLRLPGTLNHKYDPPRVVVIELFEPRRVYTVQQIEDALPAQLQPVSAEILGPLPARIPEGERNSRLYRLARSLHARGLSHADILAALCSVNQERCNPPLAVDEVEQLAQHAVTQADRSDFRRRGLDSTGSPGTIDGPVLTDRTTDPGSGDSGNSGEGDGRSWEQPIPFHTFTLPTFPTAVLPDWLRNYVEAIATETQTPPDLAALVTLSVVAATCAKVVEVHVRPGWVEPVNLFAVVAMDPGNRKSAVFSAATAPLESAEQMENQVRAPEILVAQSQLAAAKERLQDAQAALKKASAEEQADRQQDVQNAADNLSETTVPVLCRRLADDITPEKLASLLAEQDGRIALMSAEGDVFDMLAGRYTGGGGVNFGVFLKGHSGDTIRVDRIGRPPEYVERPALIVCLTVQPEVIRGLHRRPEFKGRGLLGRFFYALPESLLGRRKIRPPSMPHQVRAQYQRAIEKLAALAPGRDSAGRVQAHELRLSRDGERALEEFERWLEPQLAPTGDLASMTDWAGKLAGGVYSTHPPTRSR